MNNLSRTTVGLNLCDVNISDGVSKALFRSCRNFDKVTPPNIKNRLYFFYKHTYVVHFVRNMKYLGFAARKLCMEACKVGFYREY